MSFAARIGPVDSLKYAILGDSVECAKSLARLARNYSTDLLISQEVWQHSDAKFTGEPVGEVKLTSNTGLIGCFTLSGYRNEQGEAVIVEASSVVLPTPGQTSASDVTPSSFVVKSETKNTRWLINNGSQMVGPLSPKEIASRLFAQELDFDCECWAEGTGSSAQIKNAGIFSGSQDPQANLWLFDGETIHGPVSSGFVRTALGHGAIQPQTAYLCENSTVNGWVPLSVWDPDLFKASEENAAADDALRASLAPPKVQTNPTTESPVDPQKKAA
jgi:hypothetical protein